MDRIQLPERIETERLLIQRLRYEDAEEIFYCYASKKEATRHVAWATHVSIRETRAFLRYANDAWKLALDFSFSIRLKETRQLIGSYGVINENGRAQFGYILGPNHWGRGFATEACKAVSLLLTCQPSIYRLSSYVDCDHEPSMRVLEKCGFVKEAKLSRWMKFPNQGNLPKDCWVYVWVLPTAVQKLVDLD
jgi:[ribosomal protein S5]-alanine N-acetyltransferase